MVNPKSAAAVIIILVAVVATYVYLTYYQNTNNVFISLMDPPNVPDGTQSLNITYDSLMVHTVSGNTSGWVSLSGSGTLNLLSLTNISIVLGGLRVSNSTGIDMIRFNVSSSSIAIKNTVYPVVLPNSQITAMVKGKNTINGTMNIIADLSPTIITVFTANSTVFIMVPSIKAVMVGDKNLKGARNGALHHLDHDEHDALESTNLNMVLSNAVASISGNNTYLSVKVTDNSNQSIILKNLLVFGNISVSTGNIKIWHKDYQSHENDENESNGNATVNEPEKIAEMQSDFRTINFLINSSGGLYLPAKDSEFEGGGYSLAAGQSITLNFSGKILLGENNVLVEIQPGYSYKIVVQGKDDVHSSVNATAA